MSRIFSKSLPTVSTKTYGSIGRVCRKKVEWGPFPASVWTPRERVSMLTGSTAYGGLR
jgi:hypothetical protein